MFHVSIYCNMMNRSITMKSLIFLTLAVVVKSDENVLGGIIMGVTSLGTDVGKQVVKTAGSGVITGATLVKEATSMTANVAKDAVNGVGQVTSDLLGNTGQVLDNAIGIVDVIGKDLGPIGKPLEDIALAGLDTVATGVQLADNGIDVVETVGTNTLNTVNNVVADGSNTVIDITKAGESYLDTLLDTLNQGVDNIVG